VFAFWTMLGSSPRRTTRRSTRAGVERRVTHDPHRARVPAEYTWALLTPFVFWLAGRFSFDRSTAVKRIALLLAIGVVVAFSVDRLNSSLIAAFHVRPRYGSLAQPGGPAPADSSAFCTGR